jgi:hypothetical protein
MTEDLETIIRDHALALVGRIEKSNKAIKKTGGHPFDVGQNIAFALSLFMLLSSLRLSGVNLDKMGLGGIDPEALIEPAPKEPEPPRKRRPYGRRSRY